MLPALLDTDTLSELLKLRNLSVQQKALAYTNQHGQIAFSAMTRYEINRGYKDREQPVSSLGSLHSASIRSFFRLPTRSWIGLRTFGLWPERRGNREATRT
jgi:hypothetical protein